MNISTIDLNLLLVLHAVSEEQSVVAAARKLHVTPSAISNALSRLRRVLGDPLFVRNGRGLTATPRALELGPVVARAVDELTRVLGNADAFDPRTSAREFTIALADNDQLASLPALASAFGRALPCARLRAISVDTLIAGGGLATPVADAAVGPPLDDPELHMQPLYEEEAVLLVRRDHPRVAARLRALSRELFLALRHVDTHIALGRPGMGHRAASDMFARHGLAREIAVTVPSFAAAAMVAAQTELVAAVPRRVATTFSTLLPLRSLELPIDALRMTLSLLWHERTHRDPGARFFRALVVDTIGARKQRAKRT